MWKIELRKLYMNEMVMDLEIFNQVKETVLGKICFSEQIFYRKESLAALDQNCEKQQ